MSQIKIIYHFGSEISHNESFNSYTLTAFLLLKICKITEIY